MEAITLPIYSLDGKELESIKLNTSVFDGTINTEAIYQAINAYRAGQRRGVASTKTRGEVSGGGKKPWKQKGTGRARVGSTRSPLWRHGGVVFGPHPRDFSYKLPTKIKTLALKSSLNSKVKENSFMVLDNLSLDKPKTKEARKIFSNLKINSSALLILGKIDKTTRLALRNLSFLDLNTATDTNVYEVITHKKIIVTKDGLTGLINRLKK